MSKVIIQAGQNIGDIAIQYCGDHQAIFEIARLNNLSITDEVAAGTEIEIPNVYDARVRRFFVEGDYHPATAAIPFPDLEQGIGFWTIGVDFCVEPDSELGVGEMVISSSFQVR